MDDDVQKYSLSSSSRSACMVRGRKRVCMGLGSGLKSETTCIQKWLGKTFLDRMDSCNTAFCESKIYFSRMTFCRSGKDSKLLSLRIKPIANWVEDCNHSCSKHASTEVKQVVFSDPPNLYKWTTVIESIMRPQQIYYVAIDYDPTGVSEVPEPTNGAVTGGHQAQWSIIQAMTWAKCMRGPIHVGRIISSRMAGWGSISVNVHYECSYKRTIHSRQEMWKVDRNKFNTLRFLVSSRHAHDRQVLRN